MKVQDEGSILGVTEPVYEMLSGSLETPSKIQQNHSAIQQHPILLAFVDVLKLMYLFPE